jgi:hypothetical protein
LGRCDRFSIPAVGLFMDLLGELGLFFFMGKLLYQVKQNDRAQAANLDGAIGVPGETETRSGLSLSQSDSGINFAQVGSAPRNSNSRLPFDWAARRAPEGLIS